MARYERSDVIYMRYFNLYYSHFYAASQAIARIEEECMYV